MFIARAMCGVTSAREVRGLVLQLQSVAYLERLPAALNESGRSVSVVMKTPTITTVELHTVHLYRHCSLFMYNKLQCT